MSNWRDRKDSDFGLPSAASDLQRIQASLDTAASSKKPADKSVTQSLEDLRQPIGVENNRTSPLISVLIATCCILAACSLWLSISGTNQSHADTEQQIRELKTTIALLRTDLDNLKSQVGGFSASDFENIKSAVEALNSDGLSDIKHQNDALKGQNSNFKKQNSELLRKLSDDETRISDLEERLRMLEKKVGG